MKKRQGAVDVATVSAIFLIVFRLLTHAISNLALQAMEKVPDNSARCFRRNTQAVGSRARPKHKIGLGKPKIIALSRI